MNRINETLDQIDAAVFSSDYFHDKEERIKLLSYCKRWVKELSVEDGQLIDPDVEAEIEKLRSFLNQKNTELAGKRELL